MNAFYEAAKLEVLKRPETDPMRVALEYLLKRACGSKNSKPWPNLSSWLSENGIEMSKKQFQQTVLKKSRSNGVFIGSNDSGESRGYFIIVTKEDALVMRDFYLKRIAAEKRNLDSLNRLISIQF
jgi:hypothetical protein